MPNQYEQNVASSPQNETPKQSDVLIKKLMDVARKYPAISYLLVPIIGALTAGMITDTQRQTVTQAAALEMWPVSAEARQNGTVPPPPEVTPPTEFEPQEMGNFGTLVKTEPQAGVVVAYLHSPTGNQTLLDETINLSDWAASIQPTFDSPYGYSHPNQFPPQGHHGVLIGAQPRQLWENLITQLENEGDDTTANFLRNYYPPLQEMTAATITIDNVRSTTGENMLELNLTLKADGTAIASYQYPSYRYEGNNTSTSDPLEIGVELGFLPPLSEITPSADFSHGITATYNLGENIEVTNGSENIVVAPPTEAQMAQLVRSSSVFTEVIAGDLLQITYSASDEEMRARDQFFRENYLQPSLNGEVVQAAALDKPLLSEGDMRLGITIRGTENVNAEQTYAFNFDNGKDISISVLVSDIKPDDILRLTVKNDKLVVENLSGTDHEPDVIILGEQPNPNPDPDEEFPNQVFAPSIRR